MAAQRDKNGRFLKGSVPNPTGRPKEGESWATIIKEMSEMTSEQIRDLVGKNNELGRAYDMLPKGVPMKKLITARVFTALLYEPSSNLWNGLMDRAEGKIPDKIEGNLGVTLEWQPHKPQE